MIEQTVTRPNKRASVMAPLGFYVDKCLKHGLVPAFIALVLALASVPGHGQAPGPAPAPDVACNVNGQTQTRCNDGVNVTNGVATLIVDAFQGNIQPPAGTPGVDLKHLASSLDLTVRTDNYTITTETDSTGIDHGYGVRVSAPGTGATATLTFSGNIVTRGGEAHALRAYADGAVNVTLEGVGSLIWTGQATTGTPGAPGAPRTPGEQSHGIFAESVNGTVTIVKEENTGIITATKDSHGIYGKARQKVTITHNGSSAGLISTSGSAAHGIFGHSTDADVEIKNYASVTVGGTDSVALRADAMTTASISVEGTSVSASGTRGVGIGLTAKTQADVDVKNSRVKASGANGIGIHTKSDGPTTVTLTKAVVEADNSDGTALKMEHDSSSGGAMNVVATESTLKADGEDGKAIEIDSRNGDVTLNLTGGGNTISATGKGGVAIHVRARGKIRIDNGTGTIQGGSGTDGAAIVLDGGTDDNEIINKGTIRAGVTRTTSANSADTPGLAIKGSDNNDTIKNEGAGAGASDNSGTIVGRVDLGAGNDTFMNAGRFLADGVSDFGEGDDTFTNTGLLGLDDATPHKTNGTHHAVFTNLETLDNSSGTITMQNGTFGDSLELASGAYNGGGTLALDATSSGADKLLLRGSISGTTTINVRFVPKFLAPIKNGILLVEDKQGSSSDTSFKMSQEYLRDGFYDYYLKQKDDPDASSTAKRWILEGQINPLAQELPIIAVGAQELWRASSLPWHAWSSDPDVLNRYNRGHRYGDDVLLGSHASDGFGDPLGGGLPRTVYNDGRPMPIHSAAWLSGFGGFYDHNSKNGINADQAISGVQGGIALAVYENARGGTLVGGVTAGVAHATLKMETTGTKIKYSGKNAGAYANYYHGPLYVGLLAKADWITAEYDADYGQESSDILALGMTAVTGLYIKPSGKDFFLEPSAEISVVQTDTQAFSKGTQHVAIDDDISLQASVGARGGYHGLLINEVDYKAYISGSYTFESNGKSKVTLINTPISDSYVGGYGEVGLGGQISSLGVTAFFDVGFRFGERIRGFNGKIGGRFTW